MKIPYFAALFLEIGNAWKSDHGQYDIVFTQDDFIDYHLEPSKRFVLFAVYNFFVEVEYDFKGNEIIGKRSFVSGAILDKYSDLNSLF